MEEVRFQYDYYQLLGVTRDCTADELKKAYRKMALMYHPDRNPDQANAQERFKEITEAYAVLGDSNRRQKYDRIGHAGFRSAYSSGSGSMDFSSLNLNSIGEIFGSFLNAAKNHQKNNPAFGDDVECDLWVTFEQAALGAEVMLSYTKKVLCSACHGQRNQPGTERPLCRDCDGQGIQLSNNKFLRTGKPCETCSGWGVLIPTPCQQCEAKGWISVSNDVKVKVPSGVKDGAVTTLKTEGDDCMPSVRIKSMKQGDAGDLHVTIKIKPHPFFTRQGKDVLIDVPLGYPQMVLGDTIEVPTVNGKVSMRVPPGTQPGTTFRLKGKGVISMGGYAQGDQLVKIFLEVPTEVSDKQRLLLQELSTQMGTSVHPQQRTFLEKLKFFF